MASHEFRRLRLCNAAASWSALEMRKVQEPRLVEYPLPFKACRDYSLPLHYGDQLLFRADGKDVGTFLVRSVPSPGSLLLLVPFRKGESANGPLVFHSHVFAQKNVSQVAVIDTLDGNLKHVHSSRPVHVAETKRHQGKWTAEPHGEALRYNSVVSLTPGFYQLGLHRGHGEKYINARGQDDYVAVRVHADSASPEELIVFPHLTLTDLDHAARSIAADHHRGIAAILTVVSILRGLVVLDF